MPRIVNEMNDYIECYYCGKVTSAEGAEWRREMVETGMSGPSTTYSGSISGRLYKSSATKRKGSGIGGRVGASVNSGRTYYKAMDVYMCRCCVECEEVHQSIFLHIATLLVFAFIGGFFFVSSQYFWAWVIGMPVLIFLLYALDSMEQERIRNEIRKKYG